MRLGGCRCSVWKAVVTESDCIKRLTVAFYAGINQVAVVSRAAYLTSVILSKRCRYAFSVLHRHIEMSGSSSSSSSNNALNERQ